VARRLLAVVVAWGLVIWNYAPHAAEGDLLPFVAAPLLLVGYVLVRRRRVRLARRRELVDVPVGVDQPLAGQEPRPG
jgi:hypothetical protein